eukprot:SAG22_NODE_10357_length_539_cov_1.725000_2_plen_62_part_01
MSNWITDIGPLSALTSLTELSLYNNQITDIAPLSALTSLDPALHDDLVDDLMLENIIDYCFH